MSDELLYNSLDIAEAIKAIAKEKGIAVKDMLNNIGMGFNAMSHMRHGRMPSAENLAKIADYLGCSVDYLLGRTENPEGDQPIVLEPDEYPVIIKYRKLDNHNRESIDRLLDEMYKKNTPTAYSDERIEAILQNSDEMQQLYSTLSKFSSEKLVEVIRFVQRQYPLEPPKGE